MVLETGTELELDITDVAYGGRGVGRQDDGMAVFVTGVLEGERARVRVTAVHKRYAEACLLEVLVPSEHRRESGCPLAGRCGGCSYQHADYAEELRLKNRQLVSLLGRIGGLRDVCILPPIAAPSSLGYRNKIVLHAGTDGELGYYENDNRTVVDVGQCPLAVDPINERLRALRADSAFLQGLQRGESVTLRWTAHDGAVHWKDGETSGGPLTEATPVGDLQVPRGGFSQINPAVASLLTRQVSALILKEAPEYLIDLYSGVGVFALAAAQARVPHVLSVEVNGPAVRAARSNARRLKIDGVTFAEGDAAEIFAGAISHIAPGKTMVIADPPRDGLSAALCRELVANGPATLVYVSCAPDTLARDLKLLTAGGYRLEHCQVIDMFPRTAHFETLSFLRRE
jgi:tRNA/tmRNA/rRNA uracil-C5-methylase (TrmA/RlmC/RlmD family)